MQANSRKDLASQIELASLRAALIKRLDGRIGSIIRVKYAPSIRIVPTDGYAVKTYGLWIDGEKFRSPEDHLQGDQMLAYGVLPVIGLGMHRSDISA